MGWDREGESGVQTTGYVSQYEDPQNAWLDFALSFYINPTKSTIGRVFLFHPGFTPSGESLYSSLFPDITW